MIQPFDELEGAFDFSGYTAGHTENPTYEEVKSHQTGHTEAVEIIFNPEKSVLRSFDDLLAANRSNGCFWPI